MSSVQKTQGKKTTSQRVFEHVFPPMKTERKLLNLENVLEEFPEFDKSKYIFVTDRFNNNQVFMIERSGKIMKNYLEKKGAINELLTPIYNQRLVFDFDFKEKEYPEGLPIDTIDKLLRVLKSLGKDLKCGYRIAGYGRFPQKDVDKIINEKHYTMAFEENHSTDKILSVHAIYDIVASAKQWVEIFRGSLVYLSDGTDKFVVDTSVYKEKNHLLRFPFSNKVVNSTEIIKTAISSVGPKSYKNWCACVDTKDEDIDTEKLEILKQWVVIEQKTETNNNDAIEQNDDINDDDENTPKKMRVYKGPTVAEPNIKLPLGLIEEILNMYPLEHTGQILYINSLHDNYEYFSALNNFIRSCPYEYDEIKEVLYEAYNRKRHHSHPYALNDYAKSYIGTGKISNEYFIELIKPFKRKMSFTEYLEEKKFDIEEYESLKDIKFNTICKQKREYIKKIFDKRKELREEYIEEYGNNEIYKEYKRILNIFRVFETPYVVDSKFNYFFDDSRKMEFQFKKKDVDGFLTCPKDKIHILDNSININKVIATSKSEYKKLLQKYIYFNDANIANGKRILDIFKAGFVNEYDYNVYMDFIRFKLLNPKKLYIKNFVCYEGKDSLKTSFINMVGEYITVGIVPVNLIHSQFNGYMNNSICVYEELPASIKESRTVIEQLKAMTSTRKISLHEKGKDSETIDNYCNIIINTNHKEVGGLFDNQTDAEMFKRFYIIKKRPIDKALINEFWDIINDNANIAACFELIKQLKPLSTDDINNTLTQEEYYSFVRNTQNNKQCLDICEIDRTINKDNKGSCWLKSTVLIRLLKENELPASKESERQQLEKMGIIQVYPNSHFRIVDIEKYYMRYYEADTPDETDKLRQHLKNTYNINTFPDIATDSSSSSSSSSDEL